MERKRNVNQNGSMGPDTLDNGNYKLESIHTSEGWKKSEAAHSIKK